MKLLFTFFAIGLAISPVAVAADPQSREFIPPPFDEYFARRVAELSAPNWIQDITKENWPERQAAMRKQLQGMLGLDPWPERTDLKATIVGTVERDGYVVEKLHFQPRPGLYLAANLYRPTVVEKPLPTILYVSGHARAIEDGVSFGNKTGYQHHGIWFAKHGYVCLILDTIQWGEILGQHWGTYRLGRWWWMARGYTPAGVEAWNAIRALDYLETRPEVDRTRIGMTGRSGGGAYTWWTAALDDRVKVAVPTAGITTLHNHVLDGAVEGHCDCMFMVNTERWDYDRVAALVAPRPLLIANTDKDTIFPLDGVMEIYNRTRALYRRLGAEDQIGLQIAEGPHKDTQPLNIGAFAWMERFLKGADPMDLIDEPARQELEPRELRVFKEIPSDERTTSTDEYFVPAAEAPAPPVDAAAWEKQRDEWMRALRTESFRAWPERDLAEKSAIAAHTGRGLELTEVNFTSEAPFAQTLWILHREGLRPEDIDHLTLRVLDDDEWTEFRNRMATAFPGSFPNSKADESSFAAAAAELSENASATAYFCPRGSGPTSFAMLPDEKRTHLLRRFYLLGETLESGQVFDITRAAAALRSVPGFSKTPLWIRAQNEMAANALYASLFVADVQRLELHEPPASHRSGPSYLNVLRHLDIPQAVALAAEKSDVVIYENDRAPWRYAESVAESLSWPASRLQVHASDPKVAE
ncbi:MAG: CocE/NonD family hydrolase [Chthoniobacteraceae bacterium]